ncbi:hypothetical protein UTI89_C3021 [Escherichia coli UTI89]|uniref:Uncharacterized protein n=1 Tax=Escherichia coli (strain UTI89 / UPEC) TaxID=364106 RepID=Q1R837_ECOUT|nr:hypothetical protein UTI89_C3021 [Escherichia coli UTI89]
MNTGLIAGLHPERVNQTGDIPKQCQQNINNERPTEPFTEQHAERRQNDGDDDSPETHMYSL